MPRLHMIVRPKFAEVYDRLCEELGCSRDELAKRAIEALRDAYCAVKAGHRVVIASEDNHIRQVIVGIDYRYRFWERFWNKMRRGWAHFTDALEGW